MQFIVEATANIGSSVAAAAAVAQFVSNEVESSAPVQAVQAIKKLTTNQIIKKMQGLESALSNLKEQLIASCVMDENGQAIEKKRKEPKEKKEKEPKEKKEKEPKEKKEKEPKEKKEKKVKEVVIVDEHEKKQNKIPMPWTGVANADYRICTALKTMYGLFIQCGKPRDMSDDGLIQFSHCGFCAECFAKCDGKGNSPVGTVKDRLASAVGQFVHGPTGKKESHYLDVLTKMNITKEEALAAAEKRGVQIPEWMFEPIEKKRGRPAKTDVVVESTVEKAPKPVKEKKEKKEKKVASVETADTPEKAGGVEKKKRGRPTKTVQQSNVDEDDMHQLILQATAAKKKRLSFDPNEAEEIAHVPIQFDDDEHDETMSVCSTEEETSTAAAAPAVCPVGNGNVDEADEDGFFNFDDEEEQDQEEQQEQQQQEVVVAAAPVEPEKKEKVEKKEKKEKKEKVEKKEKKEKKVKADKGDEGEEAAADKKKKSKKAEKKKEEEVKVIVAAAAVVANEQVEEEEEEEEELECEEYEYEGETYGLASDGDLYTQEGEHVGKVVNGEVIFNRAAVASKRR